MSLLVPDYSSSSDEEAAPRAAGPAEVSHKEPQPPAASVAAAIAACVPPPKQSSEQPKKKQKKKKRAAKPKKTALFLPPEIQRLLEAGGTLSDSDGDADGAADDLLAKHKRAAAKRPRPETIPSSSSSSSSSSALTFLPAPKRQLAEPATLPVAAPSDTPSAAPAESTANAPAPEQAYDAQQYAEYYQQYYSYYGYADQHQALDTTSAAAAATSAAASGDEYAEQTLSAGRRARHRDRELERLLQQGQFDAVRDKIVEVQGPAPDAWQAPVEQLARGDPNDIKVRASFWSSSAGGTVSSMKPSRLQRQKHQLNQLAFDAKARELELLDRKGAALKTKRETHAKYGW
ncbi:hypothetical protein ATCC90586_005658 [Pythium insidiosum]|nr:hypothetical protein ATCC90586_005658 [Pythium insidiosum]